MKAFALEHEGEKGYLDAAFGVAEAAGLEAESVAATWLLLRRFRKDGDGAAAVGGRLAGLLDSAMHPDARLHVIQTLDRAVEAGGFDAAGRKKLAKALRTGIWNTTARLFGRGR